MLLEVKQPELKKELKTALNGISRSATMPILKSFKLTAEDDRLHIEATDLEIGVKTSVSAKIMSEGSVCVPAKKLNSYIKECAKTKPVKLEKKDNDNLDIECGASHTVLQGAKGDEFPSQPEIDSEVIKFDGDKFKDMLEKTKFCASDNEAKPFLCGVHLDFNKGELSVVGTDTYKLSCVNNDVNTDIDTNFILPTVTADTLVKELGDEVKFMFDENSNLIKFKDGKTVITSRLIEGDYPNYKQVIPEEKGTKFTLESDKLKGAIKRTMVTNEDDKIVNLNFEDDLIISNKESESGYSEEELEGELEGESYLTALNGDFMLNYLKHIEGKITIISQGRETPVLFKSKENDNFVHVIMPIRPSNR